MQQIKIFKCLENETPTFEVQVNRWLAETGVRVLNIFGNIAPQSSPTESVKGSISPGPFVPSDVVLVILYEKV